jgi:hypothetical protein
MRRIVPAVRAGREGVLPWMSAQLQSVNPKQGETLAKALAELS